MTWAATFRSITGNIKKLAPFSAFGTDIRWFLGGDGVTTLVAFPVSQVAGRAYISYEPSICRIATMCTNILFVFIFHFFLFLSIFFP
jgi:hypothetical protein